MSRWVFVTGAQGWEQHWGVLCGRLAGGFLAGSWLDFYQRLNSLFITFLLLMSNYLGLALALLVASVT